MKILIKMFLNLHKLVLFYFITLITQVWEATSVVPLIYTVQFCHTTVFHFWINFTSSYTLHQTSEHTDQIQQR